MLCDAGIIWSNMPGGRDGEIRCLLNMVVVDGGVRAIDRSMMVTDRTRISGGERSKVGDIRSPKAHTRGRAVICRQPGTGHGHLRSGVGLSLSSEPVQVNTLSFRDEIGPPSRATLGRTRARLDSSCDAGEAVTAVTAVEGGVSGAAIHSDICM